VGKLGSIFAQFPLYFALDIHTPLLMVHGDQDDAVPFSQAVELFSALYRMGDRPVVMLQYVGESHELNLNPQTEPDLWKRKIEFLDHFLKGAPAPAWWAQNTSYSEAATP
jgi:dipeptidyl aminopeptidase/acylaminoacyl peptidase